MLSPASKLNAGNFEAFAARLFYGSRILFVFRNPLDMAHSVRGLQAYHGDPAESWPGLFTHFINVVRLYTRMATLFPQVRSLAHEDITEASFTRLGAELGCDLSAGYAYYRPHASRPADPALVPPEAHDDLHHAMTIFGQLREVLAEGPALPQADQNMNNLSPDDHTKLGRLTMILDPAYWARVRALQAGSV